MDAKLAAEIVMWLNDGPGVAPRDIAGVDALLGGNQLLARNAIEYGAIAVRDDLATLVVRHLGVAERWPRFRDSDVDLDEFQGRVDAAAAQRGWHVTSRDGAHPGFSA